MESSVCCSRRNRRNWTRYAFGRCNLLFRLRRAVNGDYKQLFWALTCPRTVRNLSEKPQRVILCSRSPGLFWNVLSTLIFVYIKNKIRLGWWTYKLKKQVYCGVTVYVCVQDFAEDGDIYRYFSFSLFLWCLFFFSLLFQYYMHVFTLQTHKMNLSLLLIFLFFFFFSPFYCLTDESHRTQTCTRETEWRRTIYYSVIAV